MHIPPTHVAAGPATPITSIIPPNALSWITKDRPGTGDGYTENWSSLIGILTAIIGNVLISFALNMQRYAHIRLDREWQEKERQRKKRNASSLSLQRLADEVTKNAGQRKPQRHEDMVEQRGVAGHHIREATESDPLLPPSQAQKRPGVERDDSTGSGTEEAAYKQTSYLKSPYWWFGIILMAIGECGNFLAYGFAPASIVSPLGVVALISNCIIAPFMLKEPFRKRDALGVIIAVGGAVTVVLSANDNNPKLGPGEVWDLIKRWEFETYLGITVGVMMVLMVASNRYGEKNILIDLGLVGLFGGYTALSTKGVASLLSYTLWRAITFPVFYLLVAILVGTAVMQIKYINRALQRFDATQVIPVQFVLFTLSVIGGSAVLYRDFERTSAEDAGKFVGGCALTFFGVWLITSGRPGRDEEEDEEDDEPESEEVVHLAGERYADEVGGRSDQVTANTRRSSTTRQLSPPIEIHSHYCDGDSRPSTPEIRVIPEPVTPPNRTRPATSDILSSIVANPWAQGGNEPEYRTPPLNRHTSTPVLPSEAAPPPLVSISDSNRGPPETPTRGRSYIEAPTTPGSQPPLRRLRTGDRVQSARNSVAGPLLASPLSTSLSTMVQDLKRGGSIRRQHSLLGLRTREGEDVGGMLVLGEPLTRRPTRESFGPSEGVVAPGRMGRGRSLSGTLNELWRGIRGQGSREDMHVEEVARDVERER
ncbi:hypothetical protein CFE70_001760 [Pyrenophora teres f. teres 0-1]|uniref:DUF803-domain-containing protein n=1 Tax=Pyrenophora teres f. teres (strain 0-1) TaxID=861557 RepID=E3S7J2_PYRTT|nr:hypothetical protein PTT_18798 [Pyrenophora teres f. teres 0-1]KAE8870020.1 hypothetical protein PTNB29_00364 [Pyrenophora teres f. teres]